MTDDDKGAPIYINMPRFLEVAQRVRPPEVIAVVMGLLGYCNYQAFDFDPVRIAAFMSERRPDDITPEQIDAWRPELLRFYVELSDGRWALNPEIFSVVDGNPGSMS